MRRREVGSNVSPSIRVHRHYDLDVLEEANGTAGKVVIAETDRRFLRPKGPHHRRHRPGSSLLRANDADDLLRYGHPVESTADHGVGDEQAKAELAVVEETGGISLPPAVLRQRAKLCRADDQVLDVAPAQVGTSGKLEVFKEI